MKVCSTGVIVTLAFLGTLFWLAVESKPVENAIEDDDDKQRHHEAIQGVLLGFLDLIDHTVKGIREFVKNPETLEKVSSVVDAVSDQL